MRLYSVLFVLCAVSAVATGVHLQRAGADQGILEVAADRVHTRTADRVHTRTAAAFDAIAAGGVLRVGVDVGGGSGHQASAVALIDTLMFKGFAGTFQAVVADNAVASPAGALWKLCKFIGIRAPTAVNCADGVVVNYKGTTITLTSFAVNDLSALPNPGTLSAAEFALIGASDNAWSDNYFVQLSAECIVILQPFKWAGGGGRQMKCRGDPAMTYITSTKAQLGTPALKKAEMMKYAMPKFEPIFASTDVVVGHLLTKCAATGGQAAVELTTVSQLTHKTAELVLHYAYRGPTMSVAVAWNELTTGIKALVDAVTAGDKPANMKALGVYVIIINDALLDAVTAKACTAVLPAVTPPATLQAGATCEAQISAYIFNSLPAPTQGKVTVNHWSNYNNLLPDAGHPVYVMWANRLAPLDFRSLSKLSTVTVAEGANTVGFAMDNAIPVITPFAHSIVFPEGKAKAMIDAATVEFAKSLLGNSDTVKAVLDGAKDPKNNVIKYVNKIYTELQKAENDQVQVALDLLNPKLTRDLGSTCHGGEGFLYITGSPLPKCCEPTSHLIVLCPNLQRDQTATPQNCQVNHPADKTCNAATVAKLGAR